MFLCCLRVGALEVEGTTQQFQMHCVYALQVTSLFPVMAIFFNLDSRHALK